MCTKMVLATRPGEPRGTAPWENIDWERTNGLKYVQCIKDDWSMCTMYMHVVSSKPTVSGPRLQHVCAVWSTKVSEEAWKCLESQPSECTIGERFIRDFHDGIMIHSIDGCVFAIDFWEHLQWSGGKMFFSRKFELCLRACCTAGAPLMPLCRPDSALRPWFYASWFWFLADELWKECWGWRGLCGQVKLA